MSKQHENVFGSIAFGFPGNQFQRKAPASSAKWRWSFGQAHENPARVVRARLLLPILRAVGGEPNAFGWSAGAPPWAHDRHFEK